VRAPAHHRILQSLKPQLRYLLSPRVLSRIVCCIGIAVLLVFVANSDQAMLRIQQTYAHATAWVLNVFGEGAAVTTNTVQSQRFGINVVTACTGIFLTGLFVIAVVAWPSRLRTTLLGIAFGIATIAGLNVIRLVSLFYIGTHLPQWFDVAHVVVWQSLMILSAVALWLLWASTHRTRQASRDGGSR